MVWRSVICLGGYLFILHVSCSELYACMHLYVHVCPYNVHVCVCVFGCYVDSGVWGVW